MFKTYKNNAQCKTKNDLHLITAKYKKNTNNYKTLFINIKKKYTIQYKKSLNHLMIIICLFIFC